MKNTKLFRVHRTDLETGISVSIFQSYDEKLARKYYDDENPPTSIYSIELSVLFSGSVTLLTWK